MSVVIDAAALFAVRLDEPGAEAALSVLRTSFMSAANVAECCSRAPGRGSSAAAVLRAIGRFEIAVVPFDFDQAVDAAALRDSTRHLGASLGDRACLALARSKEIVIYTADRRLASAATGVGIDIRLIR